MKNTFHTPVLQEEAVSGLNVKKDGIYIDATLGGGGHTQEILNRGGTVIAFDLDKDAIHNAKATLQNANVSFVHDNFVNLSAHLKARSIEKVDGILFDFGVSSYQLNNPERGFSFSSAAPLDMRLNQAQTTTAAKLVNQLSENELFQILMKNAQEMQARSIAKAIVEKRKNKPITTTKQLAQLIQAVKSSKGSKLHPATKTFLALRIEVNQELENVQSVLPEAVSWLKPHGRLVCISFHEGEDRIVKHFFKRAQQSTQLTILTKSPITPSAEELQNNPRARSARLRIAEKNETKIHHRPDQEFS